MNCYGLHIKKEIEILRKQLEKAVVMKNYNLLDKDVLLLSQKLDKLLNYYNLLEKVKSTKEKTNTGDLNAI